MYLIHWHSARCQSVQEDGGNGSIRERGQYYYSEVEAGQYKKGGQVAGHRLLAYLGVYAVMQKAMPEAIEKNRTKHM